MKLNRYNYEEYFILYLDNELDNEGRVEVEALVQQNPDLKAELDMLLQSKLTPDADIAFTDKISLMRFDSSPISRNNYEEWLTSYIDDELPADERSEVERFIAANPSIQKELDLLHRTKLQPEEIVFPNKESLYRREEKARVISMRWLRVAAAAVLLLGISTTAIVVFNNDKKTIDTGGTALETSKKDNNTKNPVNDSTNDKQLAIVPGQKKNNTETDKEPDKLITRTSHNISPKEKKDSAAPVKNEGSVNVIALNNKEKKPDNNLPRPIENRNVNITPEEAFAFHPDKKPSLTDNKRNSPVVDVTPHTPETYNNPNEPDNADVVYASESSGNNQKGGLRGFLRKVTRTFEKRTNIKATDDDDRLLIAGLAIKLN